MGGIDQINLACPILPQRVSARVSDLDCEGYEGSNGIRVGIVTFRAACCYPPLSAAADSVGTPDNLPVATPRPAVIEACDPRKQEVSFDRRYRSPLFSLPARGPAQLKA